MREERMNQLNEIVKRLSVKEIREVEPSDKKFITSVPKEYILCGGMTVRREEILKNGKAGSAVIVVPVCGDEILTSIEPIVYTKLTVGEGFPAGYIEEGEDTTELKRICDELGIEYLVFNSNIADVVFNIRKEENPCSLCANMRRGMLNSLAVEHGCTKVALGHHMDDVMETFMMSLLLNGRIHTFAPVTYLSRSNVKTIRPMIYVEEKLIRAVAREKNFPVHPKTCPADGFTKRDYMSDLIHNLQKDIPRIKEHIFGAIKRSKIEGWVREAEEEKLDIPENDESL